jgi:hypothetical protein
MRLIAHLEATGEKAAAFVMPLAQRHDRGTITWAAAETGTPSVTPLHRLTRLLACAPHPMTRTEILKQLPDFPGRTHRERMRALTRTLHNWPMFHEPAPGKWQIGRRNVGELLRYAAEP